MGKHKLGKCLFFLSFLSMTQCNLNEVLTSMFIGSSVISTAATIATVAGQSSLVQDEQTVTLNDNVGQSLAIVSQDTTSCELLAQAHHSADDVEVTVWSQRDGAEPAAVEVLSSVPLADSPDIQFSLYLLSDAPAETLPENESELGDVLLVSNTHLWAQNLIAALDNHVDETRPVLILNSESPVEMSDEDMQMVLQAAWQKDAFFVVNSQNTEGVFVDALQADRRLLGRLTGDESDLDGIFNAVADRVEASLLVSVPASACESGELLLSEVVAEETQVAAE